MAKEENKNTDIDENPSQFEANGIYIANKQVL